MRRRGERTEFAVWLKQMTPHAIRLTVPIGFLERQPLLTEEAFGTLPLTGQAAAPIEVGTISRTSSCGPRCSGSVESQPHEQASAPPWSPVAAQGCLRITLKGYLFRCSTIVSGALALPPLASAGSGSFGRRHRKVTE